MKYVYIPKFPVIGLCHAHKLTALNNYKLTVSTMHPYWDLHMQICIYTYNTSFSTANSNVYVSVAILTSVFIAHNSGPSLLLLLLTYHDPDYTDR